MRRLPAGSSRYFSYVLAPERRLPWPVTAAEAVGILAAYFAGLVVVVPGTYWAVSGLNLAAESVFIALAVVFLAYTSLFRAMIRRARPHDTSTRQALTRQD